MVDKIDPVLESNAQVEPQGLNSEFIIGMQPAAKASFKYIKILYGIVIAVLAIGASYYWLISSDNVMQAFIPYDEDKAVLLPDHDHKNESVSAYDMRILALEEKLAKMALLQPESDQPANITNAHHQPAELQLAEVTAKIAQLEQRLDHYVNNQNKNIDIYVSWAQLKEEIDQGNAYQVAIDHLIDITRSYSDIQNILHPLVEYASLGVASYSQLQEELATIMSNRKNEENKAIDSGGKHKWWNRIVNLLKSIVKVRKITDNPALKFNNLYEVYPKIENFLALATVKPAIELITGFEKDFSPHEHNFYHQMIARVTVEDCFAKLDKLLSSPGFIQILNKPQ